MAKDTPGAPARSLLRTYPRRVEVPLLLILSLGLLVTGLILPVLTIKKLLIFKSTFSIFSGIAELFDDGHALLALVIILLAFLLGER